MGDVQVARIVVASDADCARLREVSGELERREALSALAKAGHVGASQVTPHVVNEYYYIMYNYNISTYLYNMND